MLNHRQEFSIEAMSMILNVSTSGDYEWLHREPSKRENDNKMLLTKIENIFNDYFKRYGSPRVYQELRSAGEHVGENRVAKIMAKNGMKSIYNTRKKVKTTISNHSFPVSPNLLNRNFNPAESDLVWVSDITYIHSQIGWLYLCQVKDLYSKRIVGWSIATHMRTEMVIEALQMAIDQRGVRKGLLFHSDRGSQYCSNEFRKVLQFRGIISSMSRKGNCWDNAPAESFFATLKCELVYHVVFKNLDDARRQIFHYIEFFYNRIRRHSALGYLSPMQFEKLNAA
jgi:transposase InsO family protein